MEVCQNIDNVTEVAQRSSEWFSKRIGKITLSKAPAVIGLQEKGEFQETWDCNRSKKAEPSKNVRNFHRGIVFEDEASKCFASESAAVVEKCGLYVLESDQFYGASSEFGTTIFSNWGSCCPNTVAGRMCTSQCLYFPILCSRE